MFAAKIWVSIFVWQSQCIFNADKSTVRIVNNDKDWVFQIILSKWKMYSEIYTSLLLDGVFDASLRYLLVIAPSMATQYWRHHRDRIPLRLDVPNIIRTYSRHHLIHAGIYNSVSIFTENLITIASTSDSPRHPEYSRMAFTSKDGEG